MNIYVLSCRGLNSAVFYDPLFELENLLVQTCKAKLLVPTAREVKLWVYEQAQHYPPAKLLDKIINRTMGSYKLLDDSFQAPVNQKVLFLIGICGQDLRILSSIPRWRKYFNIVVAYIADAWQFHIYPECTRDLDHLFVPIGELIEPLQKHFGIPVSLLPFGCDVLTQGSGNANRPFDVVSYGRIPEPYHRAFTQAFNQPGSGRIYYRPTPRPVEVFPKIPYENRRDQEDRTLLFKILRRTKLALAFDTMYLGMRTFPYPVITPRWFDCGAAGCAIVGKRPTTPLVDELLSWEDATIELPDDPQESVKFVEELLQDKQRLEAIHKRNYVENLARHDWRFRIKSMLDHFRIPIPDGLVEELSQLKSLHAQVSKTSGTASFETS